MNNVEINTNQQYFLEPSSVDPKDGLVKITSGLYATINIKVKPGFNLQGFGSAILPPGKSMIIQYGKYRDFFIISGWYPFSTVTISPVLLQGVYFNLIGSQSEYNFDGTKEVWNPDGINLINQPLPFFYIAGILETPKEGYFYHPRTGEIQIIGEFTEDTPAALLYQITN